MTEIDDLTLTASEVDDCLDELSSLTENELIEFKRLYPLTSFTFPLSDNLLSKVFSFLEEKDLGRVASVSLTWRKIAYNETFWQQFCKTRGWELSHEVTWKEEHTKRMRELTYEQEYGQSRAENFEFKTMIKMGGTGEVFHVIEKQTGTEFVMKRANKEKLKQDSKIASFTKEKNILAHIQPHYSVVQYYYGFQDETSLYMLMEYCQGGNLEQHVTALGYLSFECTQFYAAELLVTLSYLQTKGIILREIKPHHLLLDVDNHLKITDFSAAKIVEANTDVRLARASSYVSSDDCIPPELISAKKVSYCSDLWLLGVTIFYLMSGKYPFKRPTQQQTYQATTSRTLIYPDHFSAVTKDLLDKILVVEPDHRLGAMDDFKSIRSHQFFAGIDWNSLSRIAAPPLSIRGRPNETDVVLETKYFGENFDREKKLERQLGSQWAKFLKPGELILKCECLNVKVDKAIFSNRRQLLLTDTPRLLYINPSEMVCRELEWEDVKPFLKDKKHFPGYGG